MRRTACPPRMQEEAARAREVALEAEREDRKVRAALPAYRSFRETDCWILRPIAGSPASLHAFKPSVHPCQAQLARQLEAQRLAEEEKREKAQFCMITERQRLHRVHA